MSEPLDTLSPSSTYLAVFLALMVGTALTTWIAYVDLGRWNTVVALTIAVIKMVLVVLFFMHAKYATGLTRVIIIAGFFWLGIMITLSLSDELTRHWEIVPQGWNMIVLPSSPASFSRDRAIFRNASS